MFKIERRYRDSDVCWIVNESENPRCYLHSNGDILSTTEYWPTMEQAQAVLDKYRPKHKWEHGDVFDYSGSIMIYLHPNGGKVEVYYIGGINAGIIAGSTPDSYLCDLDYPVKFLFNIKEKI